MSVLGLLFTRRQAKQEERKDIENEILHTNVTRVLEETEKIVENQDRQDEIDAHPSPTRDDIHKWMRGETKASPKRNKNK